MDKIYIDEETGKVCIPLSAIPYDLMLKACKEIEENKAKAAETKRKGA